MEATSLVCGWKAMYHQWSHEDWLPAGFYLQRGQKEAVIRVDQAGWGGSQWHLFPLSKHRLRLCSRHTDLDLIKWVID